MLLLLFCYYEDKGSPYVYEYIKMQDINTPSIWKFVVDKEPKVELNIILAVRRNLIYIIVLK